MAHMLYGRWIWLWQFAEMVMEGFGWGMLPIDDGTRLGTFLCHLLRCTPARLSSKLRTGKKTFRYLQGAQAASEERAFEYEQQQRRLSRLEELFLHYLTPEEAAGISRWLQLEWRIQFLALAARIGQVRDG
jgi:hypothetical protein